jgi:hypothetical protein
MFLALLAGLLLAGLVHARLQRPVPPGRTSELVLVYVLVGYCGVMQVFIGSAMFVVPDRVAALVGVPVGNPIEIWTAALVLGAGIVATLTVRLRGDYLIAPVVIWAIFFLAASYAHLQVDVVHGRTASAGRIAWLLATHALVSLVLVGLLIAHRSRLRGISPTRERQTT